LKKIQSKMYSDKRPFCSREVLGIYASLLGMQISYAVNGVLVGNELSKGLNPLAFIVYSNGVGALVLIPFALFLEKRKRPATLSLPLFARLFLLSMGGMEKVDIRSVGSKSKIVGTLVCVSGAMGMSFLRGPALSQLWPSGTHSIFDPNAVQPTENVLVSFLHEGNGDSGRQIRGCIYLVSAVTILSTALILQAETVKKYPAPLSLTSITAILGSIQTAVLITVMDRGIKPTSWVLDRSGILTILNAGISCNGIGLALQLWCMQKRGPAFVTIFSPVSTVCSAILSSLFLGDTLHLGSVMGVLLIFAGLYLVLWGRSQESVTHIKISSEKEEYLHTAEDEEEYHHPSSSQDVKIPLLRPLPISK